MIKDRSLCLDVIAPHKSVLTLLALVALIAPIALLAACGGDTAPPAGGPGGPGGPPGGGPPPLPMLVASAELRAIGEEVSTVGSLRSPETTTVAADVSGIITRIDAREGQTIEAGAVVATLDSSEAEAAVQVAEARQRAAKITLDRVAPLVRDGVVPQQQLDDAEAEMATAEGLLKEVRTRLEKHRVVAPFSGRVGIRTAQLGQFVSSGDAIIELTKTDPLELVFGVPEEVAGTVRVGQRVDARVGRCGEAFDAVIEALDPQVDPAARTLAVQAQVANSDGRLIPGMSARVRFTVGASREHVVIPREALVARGTNYAVYVVESDAEAEVVSLRPVQVHDFLPDVASIAGGIEVGERVVAAGHQKLRPGARIVPQPWAPTDNPNLGRGSRFADDCGPGATGGATP